MSHHYVIVGCGDIGRRVAKRLLTQGERVTGISRSETSHCANKQLGITSVSCDLSQTPEQLNIQAADRVFYFAPPSDEHDTALKNWLAHDTSSQRVVLISTTGVYGHTHGEWVDESSPLLARQARAKRRITAENMALNWANKRGIACITLRVPGIYAADRLPQKRIASGEPVLRESLSPWTNRIHATDLADTAITAMNSTGNSDVFNVCDDQPLLMTRYFLDVAKALNLPEPPQINWSQAKQHLSPSMLSYLMESRRVSNAKLKRELGVVLTYPSLKQGLAALEHTTTGAMQ